jgi:chloride channel protein, CIC family
MNKIRYWLGHIQVSETILLWGLALLVGLTTGIGVWLFKFLIDLFHQVEYTDIGSWLTSTGRWKLFILPVIGGLFVGLIIHFFIGEEQHTGVGGIMESVALTGGRLRYQRAPAKMVAAAISIGSGASIGPEDPSVQIGSYLGSMVSQLLHFSDDRMRALVAAGAASGISAAFNAPIAGVFFSLEIILGEINGSAFGVVMLASVAAAVFTQIVSGTQPAFQIPPSVFQINWQLPLYLALGLFCGVVSSAYIHMIYLTRDVFAYFKRVPIWAKPAIAGLIIGIVGLFLPQLLGVGYVTISEILSGTTMGIMILLVLSLVKAVMTPTSLAGGFIGGVVAPSLFIGATLGGAFGQASALIFPSLGINPVPFAMVGMAAVLSGAIHAPLMAIILLFEMTNDYHIILPAMFAVVISQMVSQRFAHDSIYTMGLARHGIRLQRGRDVEVLETVNVGEVMQPAPFTFHNTDSLATASKYFLDTHHHGVPVVNEHNELVGIFTLQDLDATQADKWQDFTVGEVCTHNLLVAYPDETIGSALRRMGQRDIGRLPVVPRDNPRHLIGLLRRTDLVRAYDAALTRRAAMRHRVHQIALGAIQSSDLAIDTLLIQPDSIAANKHINEVMWPGDCIVASVRRGSQTIIPHGDTIIKPGDELVIVSESPCTDELLKITRSSPQSHPINDK